MAAIRILIVDDHTLFRRGLIALLARNPQLQVVGDAADAGEAQRRARELQPDLVLLDNHLPGVSGVDALPSLREAAPAARFLMLTVSEDADDMARALRNGASGYLLKTMEGEELAGAIRRAMRGEAVIAGAMPRRHPAASEPSYRCHRIPPSPCWRRCRRVNSISCAASRGVKATRRLPERWQSPRPPSRSTCSTSCASSPWRLVCARRCWLPRTGYSESAGAAQCNTNASAAGAYLSHDITDDRGRLFQIAMVSSQPVMGPICL